MNGRKWQMNSQQLSSKTLLCLSLIAIFILIGCEEKVPEYIMEDSPVEFIKINLGQKNIIQDTTIKVDAGLGESDYLFIGNDRNINSYALLRFSELLDEVNVDSILDLKLVLYTSSLCADTSGNPFPLVLSMLRGEKNWDEDTTCYKNFSLDEAVYENIDTLFVQPSDTVYVELEDSLYKYWRDVSGNGLVLSPLDTVSGMLITVYSSESGNQKPKLFVEYVHNGDTLSHVDYCSEDVSILRFKRDFNDRGHLNLSRGVAYRSYILIDLPDSIRDSDVVAKCELRLRVDRSETIDYGRSFSFYTAYIDTGMWLNPEKLPGIINATLTTVHESDSVAIVELKQIVQEVIEQGDSLRLVMWTSSYTPDVSILSIFGTGNEFAGLNPSIELILMREK